MQNLPDINIDTEYNTYEGLSRQATVWGIPMIPVITIVGIFVLIALFTMQFLDLKAFAILLMAVPFLVFLKLMTQRDDQAVNIIALELYWHIQRRNADLFGNTLTLMPTKFGRERHDYERFIREDSDEAALAARLFAPVQSARCREYRPF
ncbi:MULTISPECIES: VirB3 family type IV secretion system protein [unclassified Neisseria]|uniref:VirB3 family type IV secretion system protein n=1 Tax=unclassified Neisseria TaxID=2623750 RepID=UPI001071F389|nr:MULTISPECIES: VirB3 family type IV secretion system protein [unclassified Neisseria]MBF0805003.1 VirB3 family type IV secretion system protein [Neisseria sp. 19428wB4_WF04]TFU39265.1 hypothetical protein E4T99_11985 [Neisseria sp. WF04]